MALQCWNSLENKTILRFKNRMILRFTHIPSCSLPIPYPALEMGHIPVSPLYSYPESHLKNIPSPTSRFNFKLRPEFRLPLNLCWTLINSFVDYPNFCEPLLWGLSLNGADHFYKRNRKILTLTKPCRTGPRDSFSFECWCPWNALQHFQFTHFLPWTNRWSYPDWDAK